MSGQIIGPIGVLPTGVAFAVHIGATNIQNPGFGGGSVTFINLNGGINFPAGSKVVFACTAQATLTSGIVCTIAGNNMTTVTEVDNGSGQSIIVCYYDAAISTVDTIVVPSPAGNGNWALGASYYLTGAHSGAPSDTKTDLEPGSSPETINLIIPSGGAGLAFVTTWGAGATYTPSWTGATTGGGDLNVTQSGQLLLTGAQNITAGTQTMSVTNSGSNAGMIGVSWGT